MIGMSLGLHHMTRSCVCAQHTATVCVAALRTDVAKQSPRVFWGSYDGPIQDHIKTVTFFCHRERLGICCLLVGMFLYKRVVEMCIYMSPCVYIYMCVSGYVRYIYIYIYIRVYVWMYMYIYMYIYIYMYTCIGTGTPTRSPKLG